MPAPWGVCPGERHAHWRWEGDAGRKLPREWNKGSMVVMHRPFVPNVVGYAMALRQNGATRYAPSPRSPPMSPLSAEGVMCHLGEVRCIFALHPTSKPSWRLCSLHRTCS